MFKKNLYLLIAILPGAFLAARAAAADKTPLTSPILTPTPGPQPQINGPRIFGVRPGHPLLFTVAATGSRPMTFSAERLPAGLHLDAQTGQLSGSLEQWGTHDIILGAHNASGTATRNLKIVVSEEIALTPPMGWNNYHLFGTNFTQAQILAQARAMVTTGLVNHGWSYVNIDDGWQGQRGGRFGGIQPDRRRFPDMRTLSDEVHGLGLKLGLYSTPWVESYANRIGGTAMNPYGDFAPTQKAISPNTNRLPFAIGSSSFLLNDTRQFAEWGIDYLKYDWYPIKLPETVAMSQALRRSGRDIVFSISNGASFECASDWASWTNSWRTGRDIKNEWGSIRKRILRQDKWAPHAGPGHWNDPDMMMLGVVRWKSGHQKLTHLTPDEQTTHMSAWCLMSAPLLLGCDLTRLDAFTLSLLTNDEVIAVNQDTLGQQATIVSRQSQNIVMAKTLESGAKAVGLFNLGDRGSSQITLRWANLGITGPYVVRDLWRQKDLGTFDGEFQAEVGQHGVLMLSLRKE